MRIIVQTITSPSAAFEHLCRNPGEYLWQSVVVFLTAFVVSTMVTPFDVLLLKLNSPSILFPWYVAAVLVGGVVSTLVVHLIGKRMGGSIDWRRTFVALFHARMVVFVAAIIHTQVSSIVFAVGLQMTPLEILGGIPIETFYYMSAAAFLALSTIPSVKAIRIAHSFGTPKTLWMVLLDVASNYTIVLGILTIAFARLVGDM